MSITSKEHWSADRYDSEVREIAQDMYDVMGQQVPGTSHYGYGPTDKIEILIHDTQFWGPPVDPEVATKAGTLALLQWRDQHETSLHRR